MGRSLPVFTCEQTSLDPADWSVSCQFQTHATQQFGSLVGGGKTFGDISGLAQVASRLNVKTYQSSV